MRHDDNERGLDNYGGSRKREGRRERKVGSRWLMKLSEPMGREDEERKSNKCDSEHTIKSMKVIRDGRDKSKKEAG